MVAWRESFFQAKDRIIKNHPTQRLITMSYLQKISSKTTIHPKQCTYFILRYKINTCKNFTAYFFAPFSERGAIVYLAKKGFQKRKGFALVLVLRPSQNVHFPLQQGFSFFLHIY